MAKYRLNVNYLYFNYPFCEILTCFLSYLGGWLNTTAARARAFKMRGSWPKSMWVEGLSGFQIEIWVHSKWYLVLAGEFKGSLDTALATLS